MMSIKFIAVAAITIDGKIAKGPNHFSDWTSKEDKKIMRALLNKCDVIIVGNNTYKTAIKPLSKRNCIVFTHSFPSSPGEGRMQERSNDGIYRKSDNLAYLNPGKIDVKKMINKLGHHTVAILGGAQTYSYCLENGLMDELYLTIEPIIFGQGINLFSPPKIGGVSRKAGRSGMKDINFKLISIKKLNSQGSLLLKYNRLTPLLAKGRG